MIVARTLLLLGSALAVTACGAEPSPPPTAEAPTRLTPPPQEPMRMQVAATATTDLQAVAGSGAGGRLEFSIDNGAVRVSGQLTGLSPGATHAFHVHETGDCSAPDATTAGGHLNPDAKLHGNRASGGAHHAGDIPNQVAGDDGKASVDERLEGLEIGSGSARDVVGKAVIVHAKADDYATQPTGDAGSRIACGVIVAGAPVPVLPGQPLEAVQDDGNPTQ